MKRLPIFFLFLLAMMGCHRDRNGVLYSEYPIIDRAYRTYADSLGNYTVFWFESNGSCKKEVLHFGNTLNIENNYSYWMERDTFVTKSIATAMQDSVIYRDSLFVKQESGESQETHVYRGCFYDTFIVLQSDTLIRHR